MIPKHKKVLKIKKDPYNSKAFCIVFSCSDKKIHKNIMYINKMST